MDEQLHNLENELRLKPEQHTFPHPEKLKQSEGLAISLWDELCLAAAEEGQEAITAQADNLLGDKDFLAEVEEYRSLKLRADTSVTFLGKNALKHKTSHVAIWVGMAAAAAIALLLMLPVILPNKPATPVQGRQQIATSVTPTQPQPKADVPEAASTKNPATTVAQIPVKSSTDDISKSTAGMRTATTTENKSHVAPVEPAARRQPILLAAVEQPTFSAVVASATAESIAKPAVATEYSVLVAETTDNEDISLIRDIAQRIILAKDNKHTEKSESPRPIDKLVEKSIVGLNRLLNKETVVIREYDKTGALTLYAVQSTTISFQRTYKE